MGANEISQLFSAARVNSKKTARFADWLLARRFRFVAVTWRAKLREIPTELHTVRTPHSKVGNETRFSWLTIKRLNSSQLSAFHYARSAGAAAGPDVWRQCSKPSLTSEDL